MQYFKHGGAFHTADDGETLPDGAVVLPRLPLEGETWDGAAFVFNGTGLLIKAHAAIDAQAEAARAQFITAAPGQMGTYLNKQAEAAAYLADSAKPTPYLTAEAAATGTTVAALAALVHGTATAWLAVDVKIEAARRGAKVAASEATDAAGIWAATNINWQDVINGN